MQEAALRFAWVLIMVVVSAERAMSSVVGYQEAEAKCGATGPILGTSCRLSRCEGSREARKSLGRSARDIATAFVTSVCLPHFNQMLTSSRPNVQRSLASATTLRRSRRLRAATMHASGAAETLPTIAINMAADAHLAVAAFTPARQPSLPRAHFLSRPPKLRNRIYRYVLVSSDPIKVKFASRKVRDRDSWDWDAGEGWKCRFTMEAPLTTVNHQVRREGLDPASYYCGHRVERLACKFDSIFDFLEGVRHHWLESL